MSQVQNIFGSVGRGRNSTSTCFVLTRGTFKVCNTIFSYHSRDLSLCLFSDSTFLLNALGIAVMFRKRLQVSTHFWLASLADHRGLPVMTDPQKSPLPSCNMLSFKKPLLVVEPDSAVFPIERNADSSWYQVWSQPAQAAAWSRSRHPKHSQH